MPPKKSTKALNVRSVSDARLEKILGDLCKKAESAIAAEGPEARQALKQVFTLAKKAKDYQATPLKRASKKPSRRRQASSK